MVTHLRAQVIKVVLKSRKEHRPHCLIPSAETCTYFVLYVFRSEFGLCHFILFFFFFLFERWSLPKHGAHWSGQAGWWPPGIEQFLPPQCWGSQAVPWGLASCGAGKQSSILTLGWHAPYWLSHLPSSHTRGLQHFETVWDRHLLPCHHTLCKQGILVTVRDRWFLSFRSTQAQLRKSLPLE